ncbi:MAG: DNA helicase UvrD, partial [Deltaproteobacteria bacterium]
VSLSSGTRWLLAARDRAGGDGGLYRLVQSIEKVKDDQESRRLLYVAATRAERELHLVGHLNNDRPGKGTPLELLVDAGLGCGPAVVERVPVPEREAESLVFEPLRMKHQPDAPRPVGESETPGAAIEFQWAGPLAAPVGTVIHAALCRIARRGVEQWHEGAFDAEVEQMRRDLIAEGLSGAMLEEALDRCREGLVRTLESERGRWILSGHHREAHAEWALAEDDAGRLARHQLDRSFIDEHGVRWIVDYKTATHEGGDLEAFLDSEEARHRPQLERYARILRRMEPGREIRAGLYFPLLDAWREVRLEPGAGGNGARG